MAEQAARAYDEWKRADAMARDAEAKLALAMNDHLAKKGPPPGEDLLREVSRLRGLANDKLTVAIARMSVVNVASGGTPGSGPSEKVNS